MNPTSHTTLHVHRFIAAPPSRVFAAFANPDQIVKWFGPESAQCLDAKMDVRVGGSYSLKMKACMADGPEEMTVTGKYLEVRSPERLVFTWGWEGDEYTGSQVTVDFFALDGGTDLQLTHERLANAASRDRHTHGWTGTFNKLEKLLSPEAAAEPSPQMPPGEFCWNELLTSDVGVAGKFYTELFGWNATPFPGPVPYTIFRQGEKGVGGMMPQQQPGTPPIWLSYITVADCDGSAAQAQKLGAKLCMPPKDIPTIGRIAVLTDPLGTPFGIHTAGEKGIVEG